MAAASVCLCCWEISSSVLVAPLRSRGEGHNDSGKVIGAILLWWESRLCSSSHCCSKAGRGLGRRRWASARRAIFSRRKRANGSRLGASFLWFGGFNRTAEGHAFTVFSGSDGDPNALGQDALESWHKVASKLSTAPMELRTCLWLPGFAYLNGRPDTTTRRMAINSTTIAFSAFLR